MAVLKTLDFEEGDTSDCSSTPTLGSGVVDAHGDAAQSGSYGSRHYIPDTGGDRRAAGYYTHGSGVGEYYCIFYLNINDLTMDDGDSFKLWGSDNDSGTNWDLKLQLRRSGANYQLQPQLHYFTSSWYTISKTNWVKIEVYLKRETGDGNNDGILRFWIDDDLKEETTSEPDNHDTLWKEWRFGFSYNPSVDGTWDRIYFDDIEIHDGMPVTTLSVDVSECEKK